MKRFFPLVLSLAWLRVLRGLADRPPNFVVILVDDLGYRTLVRNNPDCFLRNAFDHALADSAMAFHERVCGQSGLSRDALRLMNGQVSSRVGANPNFFSRIASGTFHPAAFE